MILPTIDVSNTDIKIITLQIKDALEKYGFFRIINHGINTEKILEVSKKFYNLSNEEKTKISMKNWRGWTKLGSEITLGKKDWHECIDYMKDIDDKKNIFYGKNQWINNMEDIIMEYIDKCNKLAKLIMGGIITSYNLSNNLFEDTFNDNFYILRLLYYPTFPKELYDDKKIGYGTGEHTDYGFLTFVSSNEEGLEIKINNKWENISMNNNDIICNIGDMLSLWSKELKATKHRVRRVTKDRYSCAFFFEPNLKAMINLSTKKKYEEYLEEKYRYSYPSS